MAGMLIRFIPVIMYVIILSITGKALLKMMRIEIFHGRLSDYIVGFLFIQIVSFISFLVFVGLFKFSYWTHFIPSILLIIWQGYRSMISSSESCRLGLELSRYYPALILFMLISTLVLYEASAQFHAAIRKEGVIHVDMVYHSGIITAILEYGYPIVDLQYAGGLIRYHIITHFIASQLTFVSGLEPYQVFVIFFPLFSILGISILIFDLVRKELGTRFSIHGFLAIGILSFLGAYLLPGYWFNTQVHEFFISPSYQLQLVIVLIISACILEKSDLEYKLKDYSTFFVLFCFCILTKGSSLPLLLMGFGFLVVHRFWRFRRIILSDVIFLCLCGIIGAIIYLVFFSFESSNGESYLTLWGYNSKYINFSYLDTLLTQKLGLRINNWVLFAITIVTYRFYIVRFYREPVVLFSIGVAFAGLLFLLFYTRDPIQFFEVGIFLINLFLGLFLIKNYSRISWISLALILFLLPLSIYPISSHGFQMKRYMKEESERYYPLSPQRYELYNVINAVTQKDDKVFTPSVYGATNSSADNFYPAALSKRIFYLGGFKYGNQKFYEDFDTRLKLVNEFSFSRDFLSTIKLEKISYILVEYDGNINDLTKEINEVVKTDSCSAYRVLHHNSAGVLIQLF